MAMTTVQVPPEARDAARTVAAWAGVRRPVVVGAALIHFAGLPVPEQRAALAKYIGQHCRQPDDDPTAPA